jgi:charged multivesicular body protein 6
LANQLTLEEEDAVQAELMELQAASVSFLISHGIGTVRTDVELQLEREEPVLKDRLPSVPTEQPAIAETEGRCNAFRHSCLIAEHFVTDLQIPLRKEALRGVVVPE